MIPRSRTGILHFEAIRSGASGYLLKGIRSEELIEQLYGLFHGETPLSTELASRVLKEFSGTTAIAAAVDRTLQKNFFPASRPDKRKSCG
jgi:DNA-binding NarL/FixJ family response regulator